MTPFLGEILDELGKIKVEDFVEPETKLEAGARVVGAMSHDLMRLFTLRDRYLRKTRTLAVEMIHLSVDKLTASDKLPSEASRKLKELWKQHCLLSQQYEALSDLFWAEVKITFPEVVGADVVSVSEGWKVSCRERQLSDILSDSSNPLGQILAAIAQRASEE